MKYQEEIDLLVARCVSDSTFRSNLIAGLRKTLTSWVEDGPMSSYGSYWNRYNLLGNVVVKGVRYENRQAKDRQLQEDGYILLTEGAE